MKCHLEDGSRRIGRFEVNQALLHDDHNLRLLSEAMTGMVVVQVEYRWDRDCATYTAFSEAFEPIPQRCRAPRYRMELGVDHSVRFTRLEA